jgi:predicted enzyme related to lactoylglutathione lyase
MQSNHITYIEFKANDLEATRQFYMACFNWKFMNYGPTYTSFSESGVAGGFEQTNEEIKNGALIVLYHKNLEGIQRKVDEAGGKITREIFLFPGGRRFHFLDPSGNELAVWSE